MVISLDTITEAHPTTLTPDLAAKHEQLQSLLVGMERVLVAYSGGIDSTLVAKVAADVLADNMLAVIAISDNPVEASTLCA